MTTLTSLARARAFEVGQAVRTATRRHVHISARPLVFVPLSMAGEANAPLGCLVGDSPEQPTLLVVPQPRNRDLRFAFVARLAATVLTYVESYTTAMDLVKERAVFTDAPQPLVANPAVVDFTRAVQDALRPQMEPTWRLVWRAAELLRTLPSASSVERRWLRDRRRRVSSRARPSIPPPRCGPYGRSIRPSRRGSPESASTRCDDV